MRAVKGTYDTAKAAPLPDVELAELAIRECVPGSSVAGLTLTGVAITGSWATRLVVAELVAFARVTISLVLPWKGRLAR
jgi:hypothetical protein